MAELQAQVAGRGQTGTGLLAESAAAKADLDATKQRVADLEATLRNLNGSIEGVTADLAQARRDLAAATTENSALRQRVAQLESAQAAAAQAQLQAQAQVQQGQAAEAARLRDDPGALLGEGRRLLQAGESVQAEAVFTDYLARFASRPEAPEARYWLGESLYVQEQHADAAQAYIAALRGWPKSAWAPDALVKLATTLVTLKQPAEACKSLAEIDRRYAGAAAAIKTRAQQVKTSAKCR